MPSTREIRRRIRSVKNTGQITKAMEMVSAVKMRRAQEAVEASRPYAERMAELVGGLTRMIATGDEVDPLLVQRPVHRVGIIVMTSDRGLAGSINTNVLRNAARYILEHQSATQAMAIGRKGRDWLIRHNAPIVAEVSGLSARPTLLEIAPITTLAINGYREGRFDQVSVVYTQFVSTSRQVTVRRQVLPVVPPEGEATGLLDYIFEPSAAGVL